MSWSMELAVVAMRAAARLRPGPGVDDHLAALRTRSYPTPAPTPRRLRAGHGIQERRIAGRPVLQLTPRGPSSGQHLIYLHGGAYVDALIRPHWWILERMTRGTGATITVPLYRLAPEGSVEQAYPFLHAVYDEVRHIDGAEAVTIAGDSAGGGLALGLATWLRDTGAPAPRQAILLAPWLDTTMSHPGIAQFESADPMLRRHHLAALGSLWAGERTGLDPLVSPCFAELHDLPPIHIFQGGRDLFAPDALELAERLADVGNAGQIVYVPGGFHVYVGAVWTPEARASMAEIRRLLTPRRVERPPIRRRPPGRPASPVPPEQPPQRGSAT